MGLGLFFFALAIPTLAAAPAWETTGSSLAGPNESRWVAKASPQDFILEFELRQDAGAPAAAIEFRASDQTGPGSGYHCSLSGSDFAGPGALAEPAGRGWLYPLMAASPVRAGEWNRFRLEAIGSSLRTWVNGQPVAHVVDEAVRAGRLALCLAAATAENAGRKTEWRAVQLTTSNLHPSPADALFVRSFLRNQLTDTEQAQGWRLLWDGVTTTGWRGARMANFPTGGWSIAQGELIVPETGGGESKKGGDIVTTEEFSTFELQLDFKLTPGANSGIKYFVDESVAPIGGSAIGLEFQLLDDERHPDAKLGLNGDRTLGSLYDLITRRPVPDQPGLKPEIGAWQHARLVVYPDNHVEHWLNGVKVVDYVRGSPDYLARVALSKYNAIARFGLAAQGHLLLQDHGNETHFRSIKLRVLAPVTAPQLPVPSSP